MKTGRRIAVAGATGRVGRHLVDVLEERGLEPVAISRSTGVDVITADGLAEALERVEAVVDAATGPSPDQTQATEFFTTAARNLQEAGERAGVERIVVVRSSAPTATRRGTARRRSPTSRRRYRARSRQPSCARHSSTSSCRSSSSGAPTVT